jgi:hypothetical protein
MGRDDDFGGTVWQYDEEGNTVGRQVVRFVLARERAAKHSYCHNV